MTTSDSIHLKQCSMCGREFVVTAEYFHKRAQSKDGFDSSCKECRGYRFTPPIPEGYKRCTKCSNEYPATPEHFPRHRGHSDGLQSHCKTCKRDIDLQYRADNPEKIRQSKLQWYIENGDAARAKGRASYAANAPQRREAVRLWQQANREKARLFSRGNCTLHRARKRALLADFTKDQWETCLEYFHNCCAYCGAQQSLFHTIEREHYLSVKLGGGYTAGNILPACRICNASKAGRPAQEWVKQKFPKKAKQILERINAYFKWVKEQNLDL